MKIFLQDRNGKNHELKVKDELAEQIFGDVYPSLNEKELTTIHIEDVDEKEDTLKDMVSKLFKNNKHLLASILCNDLVNKDYISSSSKKVEIIFLNVLKYKKGVAIKGFAYGTNPKKDELYVSVVCGTGGTAQIFDAMINNIMNDTFDKKYKYIKLDSIENPDTINFYSKLGFRKTDADTSQIIKDMYKSKDKTFEEYVKGVSVVGGLMMLFPPNKEGEKTMNKMKCTHIYEPEVWFDELKKYKGDIQDYIKKNKKSKMEGAGIGDWFRRRVEDVKHFFSPNLQSFNNVSTETINKYGSYIIKDLEIMRTPLPSHIETALQAITLGQWDEVKEKYGYDKLYHLALVATINFRDVDKKIIIEKNDVVNVNSDFRVEPTSEILKVPLGTATITIKQLLDNTLKQLGPKKFFEYDSFKNNCQYFIKYLLSFSQLLSVQAEHFLFQDLKNLIRNIPDYAPGVARKITDLSATISKLTGKGF